MYCKNIAIFSHTIALGGSERVACLLADLLLEECYNVYLIIQKKSDLSYSLKNNITICNLENSKNKYKRTREILTKYNIDLCIFNDHFRACLETHLSIMKRFNSMLAMAI